jgi:hypothetical protein
VDTPRPSPRTNRTRRVPHPVLIGHAACVRGALHPEDPRPVIVILARAAGGDSSGDPARRPRALKGMGFCRCRRTRLLFSLSRRLYHFSVSQPLHSPPPSLSTTYALPLSLSQAVSSSAASSAASSPTPRSLPTPPRPAARIPAPPRLANKALTHKAPPSRRRWRCGGTLPCARCRS